MNRPFASTYLPRRDTAVTPTVWAIAIVWFAVALALGASGRLAEYARFIGPFAVTPLIIFVVAFGVSPGLRVWAFAFDTRTLVIVQTLRIGGLAFLAVYAVGQLNGKFALWAGLLDCVVGLSAPFAAHYLTPAATAAQRRLLIGWMALGILDFLVAIPLARLARSEDPVSMVAMVGLPLSLITTYFVPIALIDYFLLGAQIWRQRVVRR